MLDPNLSILVLLLCTYVLYGFGYVLMFAQDVDKDNRSVFWSCVAVICCTLAWPFVKGAMDGREAGTK